MKRKEKVQPKQQTYERGTGEWLTLVSAALLLGGCGSFSPPQADGGPYRPVNLSHVPDAVPRSEPRSKYGNPKSYVVNGRRYRILQTSSGYVETGIASWYGRKFHGRRTSSGERYNMYSMTAAHKTLPLPTYARVTNLRNGRSVVVKINDRGPFHENRLIDLSYAAASKLGIVKTGTGLVEVRALRPGQRTTPAAARAPDSARPEFIGGDKYDSASRFSTQPGLFLQAGAFISRQNAQRLHDRLKGKTPWPVQIDSATDHQRTVYRVRLGPISDVASADTAATHLQALGVTSPQVVIERNWAERSGAPP